jgi:hypothetical protein
MNIVSAIGLAAFCSFMVGMLVWSWAENRASWIAYKHREEIERLRSRWNESIE